DLVDGKVEDIRQDVAPLAQLRARHGVFAITGNHEYYSGPDAWIAEITRLGARYLRNQRVVIGDGAASFDLAGGDEYSAECWATARTCRRRSPGATHRARWCCLRISRARSVTPSGTAWISSCRGTRTVGRSGRGTTSFGCSRAACSPAATKSRAPSCT